MHTSFEKLYNEGFKIGELLRQKEVAKNLMDILNDETIAQKCELTYEDVKILRKEYESVQKDELKIKKQIAKNLMDILSDRIIAQKCELTYEEVKILRNEYESIK